MTTSPYARKFTLSGILIAIIVIVTAIATGWWYAQKSANNPMSSEAVLSADIVNVASTVAGRVVALPVKDNQRVSKGDVLFKLDPTAYQLAVQQTKADLALAEATRDAEQRTIAAETSNAAIANKQIERAQTNLALTEKTLARLLPLESKGFVTSQSVDTARTARDDARTSLNQALLQSEAADALITTLGTSQALVDARRAAVAIAEHELAATEVRAPHDGLVVGLHVSTGNVVLPGQSMFTLIDSKHWFVTATFPEDELDRIAVGHCAKVYVLSDRSRALQGRVESIGWGVISEQMINLPRGLPYVPKSLNWVRIAQRFPVRIELDNPPADLMRVGASAVVMIQHGKSCEASRRP
jgi:membrane fusion protein, multidrug efflux system